MEIIWLHLLCVDVNVHVHNVVERSTNDDDVGTNNVKLLSASLWALWNRTSAAVVLVKWLRPIRDCAVERICLKQWFRVGEEATCTLYTPPHWLASGKRAKWTCCVHSHTRTIANGVHSISAAEACSCCVCCCFCHYIFVVRQCVRHFSLSSSLRYHTNEVLRTLVIYIYLKLCIEMVQTKRQLILV